MKVYDPDDSDCSHFIVPLNCKRRVRSSITIVSAYNDVVSGVVKRSYGFILIKIGSSHTRSYTRNDPLGSNLRGWTRPEIFYKY